MNTQSSGNNVKRIGFAVINIVLALGAFVPLTVDMALNHHPTWSVIVLGAIAMLWLIVAPWFVLPNGRFIASWAAALISVPAYLYVVETATGGKGWFLALGLPAAIVGLAGVGVAGWLWLYSRLKFWYAASLTLFLAAAVNHAEFLLTQSYVQDPVEWAHYLTTVSLLALGALLGIIAASVHGARLLRTSAGK